MIRKSILMVTISMLYISCNVKKVESSKSLFVYQNPITVGIDERGLRDCQVIKDGDWWYLTGTAFPHGSGARNYKGVPLYKSKNLTEWIFVDFIIKRPNADKWYYNNFWAPEIQKIQGKYYVIFNCRNEDLGYNWQHMGYAVSDNIEGPYEVITKEKPLEKGNDLTFYEDEDGTVYAFWHTLDDKAGEVDRSFGIGYSKIDLEKGEFYGERKSAIKPGKVDYEKNEDGSVVKTRAHGRIVNKVKKYHSWDSAGIEGAYVIKRKGVYYLFYSSWTRGYEIGYATALNIEGPWTKADNNPIYGAMNKDLTLDRGFEYIEPGDNPFYAVGHNEVFEGIDGRLWLSCHGESKKHRAPYLVIDPLDFDEQGRIIKKSPSYTIQNINW